MSKKKLQHALLMNATAAKDALLGSPDALRKSLDGTYRVIEEPPKQPYVERSWRAKSRAYVDGRKMTVSTIVHKHFDGETRYLYHLDVLSGK